MSAHILTVTQLNTYVKSVLDSDKNLYNVFVCGEISNFTNHYRTGHFYMTLKDEGASVRAVMFKSSNSRLRFMPENGMKVVTRGRASVYERDGQYQLYIDDMQPDGAGALSAAFEQLKSKLAAEGLFDDSRKKPLPKLPMRIGVITAPTGAAVRDIITVLGRRFPMSRVIFHPVQVQGESAAPQISAAVERFNREGLADVLIVGRGGGSLEELWAFNEEIVARAVAASAIPVISAVGHETDFTICDFVADLRAPTPSAAAELAVPDAVEQYAFLNGLLFRCRRAMENDFSAKRAHLKSLQMSRGLTSASALLESRRLLLDKLSFSLESSITATISSGKGGINYLAGKLDSLSPLKVLGRGYAIASKDGSIISGVKPISKGDALSIRLSDGSLDCTVDSVEFVDSVKSADSVGSVKEEM